MQICNDVMVNMNLAESNRENVSSKCSKVKNE